MLRSTHSAAASFATLVRNFGNRYQIVPIQQKHLFLVRFVMVLAVLTQQPAVGQQLNSEISVDAIESRAHYSFSTAQPDSQRTGSSQSVLIERLAAEADSIETDLPAQTLDAVNAAESERELLLEQIFPIRERGKI
ncbi:MAG: hypothetical protein ACFB16_21440 [Phormidesmis sp.]